MRTRTARARKPVKLPDFEMEEIQRTPIRKKLKPSRSNALRPKRLILKKTAESDAEEEGREEEKLAETRDDDKPDTEDFTDVMEDIMAAEFAPNPKHFLMPQFEPECAPRTTGAWTAEEDEVLKAEVKRVGAVWGKWALIAMQLQGRSGKQCRERWHNCIGPHINKQPWTREEDLVVQMGVQEYGHRWSLISSQLVGRTDNAVKNRYNTTIQTMVGKLHRADREGAMSDDAFLRELKRRNAHAESKQNPARFSPQQVDALDEGIEAEAIDSVGPGSRWSNDEHARLAHGIPKGVPLHEVDWAAAARAVPTRNPSSCRKHWERHLRGDWKPAAMAKGRRKVAVEPPPPTMLHAELLEPEPPPEPPASLRMIDQLVKHANNPNLKLMAIEDYSEGTDGSWTQSSVLVVGKPGLKFQFAAWGKTIPPPPPQQADVIARPVFPAKTATAERWEWMMKKEACNPVYTKMASIREQAEREAAKLSKMTTNAVKQYYNAKKPRYLDVTNEKQRQDFFEAEELVKSVFV